MFLFGDPAEAARLHVDTYLALPGPDVPDIHIDEMEERDLRNVMAYLYGALEIGLQEDLDETMLDIVREWYDEAFTALAEVSERFREKVLDGSVFPPGGPTQRPKYVSIVRGVRNPSPVK